LPQQSIVTFCNIYDIEGFIKHMEKLRSKRYLISIDIPVTERNIIMRELSHMGITQSALFPGLDGICGALKEKYF